MKQIVLAQQVNLGKFIIHNNKFAKHGMPEFCKTHGIIDIEF